MPGFDGYTLSHLLDVFHPGFICEESHREFLRSENLQYPFDELVVIWQPHIRLE